MGAGKTTLVQGIGLGLGIQEPIASPTFTLVNEYNEGRLPLYHLDLYRLQGQDIQGAVPGKLLAGNRGGFRDSGDRMVRTFNFFAGKLSRDYFTRSRRARTTSAAQFCRWGRKNSDPTGIAIST
jgi:tRNA threonylcarbamoyladenosine biosynthesis protein TsaE